MTDAGAAKCHGVNVNNKVRFNMRFIFAAAAVVVSGALLISVWPDIARYRRIRNM